MNSFKNAGHLLRFAGLFVIAFVLFLVIRHYYVPKSFGQYGHYRGDAIKDDAARPTFYAGHDTCETCHADIATKKSGGPHAHVNCEACHGPQAIHALADDPTAHIPVKPDSATLCIKCHAASLAKPKKFPQVNEDHSMGMPCITCHTNPHSPAIDTTGTGGKK